MEVAILNRMSRVAAVLACAGLAGCGDAETVGSSLGELMACDESREGVGPGIEVVTVLAVVPTVPGDVLEVTQCGYYSFEDGVAQAGLLGLDDAGCASFEVVADRGTVEVFCSEVVTGLSGVLDSGWDETYVRRK